MPELSDENIQKVKEQLQNLGQKAREAIGPEKAAAISASVPVVKSVARGVAIRSLRAVQTLCAAGAEKLEEGARPRAIEAADDFDDELLTESPAPRPAEEPRSVFTPEPGPQPRTEPELTREFEIPHREVPPQPQPRPARSMPTEKRRRRSSVPNRLRTRVARSPISASCWRCWPPVHSSSRG